MLTAKYIIAGAIVGLLTGVTGIGGGSLMTPILILLLGFSPSIAVGTDLFFASLTKFTSATGYFKQKIIHWPLVGLLASGSLPASLITLALLKSMSMQNYVINSWLNKAVAIILIITTLVYLFRTKVSHATSRISNSFPKSKWVRSLLTVFAGGLIGVAVTLTSIGAGTLGTIALLLLYPHLRIIDLVATEVTHAIPLAITAGLGHAGLGHVDGVLLVNLLLGSLPTAYLASRFGHRLPNSLLRYLLAGLIFAGALRLLLAQ